MTFSEKLLDLRKQENLSQEALAEKLDVSRQAISRWESGTAMPDAMNLLQLSKLFGVSIDYLLNDELTHSLPAPKQRNAQPLFHRWGIIGSTAGLGGWIILFILSTMISVPVGRDVVYEGGWTAYETSPGYHLPTFIAEYRLYALCILFTLLAVGGIALIIAHHLKKEADNR